MFVEALALICIGWFILIAIVCAIGYVQLSVSLRLPCVETNDCRFTHYRSIPRRGAVLSQGEDDIPHVTAIRPCKGLEPYLYECLAATLQQDYPRSKLTTYYCVSSSSDPAYPTVQRVLADHPSHDAKVFVEEEDPFLQAGELGPNPKIRNMSRAYREAKGYTIWIIDCNVWINPGACGRMVDKLCGYTHHLQRPKRPYKLVHHLPLAVDVPSHTISTTVPDQANGTLYDAPTAPTISNALPSSSSSNAFGGRLEELFLSSSHAKMYVAINTVAIAPCIVGKSTMFRRSHLDTLTSSPKGIDYFSHNICEDHLIGDLLWKSPLPRNPTGLKHKNHGLVLGDLAIQPVASMSVQNYIARRVRWLRVRKFTVPAATLVEPGTESVLCSAIGAWGVNTSSYTKVWAASVAEKVVGISAEKWGVWWVILAWWVGSMVIWACIDWTNYLLLHSGATVEGGSDVSTNVPEFARPPTSVNPAAHQVKAPNGNGTPASDKGKAASPRSDTASGRVQWLWNLTPRRTCPTWFRAWLGRELLALPIWLWAIWGGVTVTWRDRRFWVGWDMKVHEIVDVNRRDEGKRKQRGEGGDEKVESEDARESNGHAIVPEHEVNGDIEHQRANARRRKGR